MRNPTPLRSLCAGLLLFMVAAPSIGLLLCQVQVCYNRFEMLERLEAETLHTINVPADDVHWLIPGKELRIGNRLFDVKESTANGATIAFTGIFDDEEEELDKKISGHSVPGNNKLPFLLTLTSAPAIAAAGISLAPLYTAYQKPTGNTYAPALLYVARDPAGPPPRISC